MSKLVIGNAVVFDDPLDAVHVKLFFVNHFSA